MTENNAYLSYKYGEAKLYQTGSFIPLDSFPSSRRFYADYWEEKSNQQLCSTVNSVSYNNNCPHSICPLVH